MTRKFPHSANRALEAQSCSYRSLLCKRLSESFVLEWMSGLLGFIFILEVSSVRPLSLVGSLRISVHSLTTMDPHRFCRQGCTWINHVGTNKCFCSEIMSDLLYKSLFFRVNNRLSYIFKRLPRHLSS